MSYRIDIVPRLCALTQQFSYPIGVEAAAVIRSLRERVQVLEAQLEEESIAEQAYWEVAAIIEPHVYREGKNGKLPASVVESVGILLRHWEEKEQGDG